MQMDITTFYDRFRSDVQAFLARSGMSKTVFGKLALNDPGFIDGLNAGRSPRPDTVIKVQAFMETWQGENSEATAKRGA